MGGARDLVKVFHTSVRGTLTFMSFDASFLLGFLAQVFFWDLCRSISMPRIAVGFLWLLVN
jgi:hypothetical protein